jgi:hypothetical protein
MALRTILSTFHVQKSSAGEGRSIGARVGFDLRFIYAWIKIRYESVT